MLKVLASSVAGAAVALAAAGALAAPSPAPSATPFALGTLAPFGSTSGPLVPALPEIGRTRSVVPACAAMRDLIVPSWTAAVRADRRFADVRKRLPNYADTVDDPNNRIDAFRVMLLSKLDVDASSLLEEAHVLKRALDDPRFSAEQTDPQVVAERHALQTLFDAQMTRANLLNEFVIRERAATAKVGMDAASGFASRQYGPVPSAVEIPAPDPGVSPPPGMPRMTGNVLADKMSVSDWSKSIAAYVYQGENQAAKTLLPIAQSCR